MGLPFNSAQAARRRVETVFPKLRAENFTDFRRLKGFWLGEVNELFGIHPIDRLDTCQRRLVFDITIGKINYEYAQQSGGGARPAVCGSQSRLESNLTIFPE